MKNKIFIIFAPIILILIIFLGILLFNKNDLKDTSWKLTGWSVEDISIDITNITLNFENKSLGGSGGVNSYSATYKLSLKNKIEINDIVSTEMASIDDEINKAEYYYFNLLSKIEYYELNDNVLKLLDNNKNTLLIFNKV